MTSLRVICGLGPPQSKILATPMGSNTSNHTQMVASNGAFSLIDKFTRMTNTSQTILDRIIKKMTQPTLRILLFSITATLVISEKITLMLVYKFL